MNSGEKRIIIIIPNLHGVSVNMFVILIMFFLTHKFTISVDPCQTSNGQEGDCVPINQCLPIFHLFHGNLSTATATFVRQSQCGAISSGYPKVCCPLGSFLPPNMTNRLLPEHPHCGTSVESKIWGGNITDLDEFPWMTLLEYQRNDGSLSFGCGGVLISARYVLTARHCLRQNLVQVRLGEWNTTSDPDCVKSRFGTDCAPKFLSVGIEEQIPHTDNDVMNDIALLRLNQQVKFNDFVKPICLPTTSDLLTRSHIGDKLFVAGWGKTEKEKPSEVKLKVLVPVKPLTECISVLRQALNVNVSLHEDQLCAGGEKGKDSCNGDSGGPLMYKKTEWYAVGIVSFGSNKPCGQENRPAVYVRIAGYMNWILSNLKP